MSLFDKPPAREVEARSADDVLRLLSELLDRGALAISRETSAGKVHTHVSHMSRSGVERTACAAVPVAAVATSKVDAAVALIMAAIAAVHARMDDPP